MTLHEKGNAFFHVLNKYYRALKIQLFPRTIFEIFCRIYWIHDSRNRWVGSSFSHFFLGNCITHELRGHFDKDPTTTKSLLDSAALPGSRIKKSLGTTFMIKAKRCLFECFFSIALLCLHNFATCQNASQQSADYLQ